MAKREYTRRARVGPSPCVRIRSSPKGANDVQFLTHDGKIIGLRADGMPHRLSAPSLFRGGRVGPRPEIGYKQQTMDGHAGGEWNPSVHEKTEKVD